jgi:hypothetical protein
MVRHALLNKANHRKQKEIVDYKSHSEATPRRRVFRELPNGPVCSVVVGTASSPDQVMSTQIGIVWWVAVKHPVPNSHVCRTSFISRHPCTKGLRPPEGQSPVRQNSSRKSNCQGLVLRQSEGRRLRYITAKFRAHLKGRQKHGRSFEARNSRRRLFQFLLTARSGVRVSSAARKRFSNHLNRRAAPPVGTGCSASFVSGHHCRRRGPPVPKTVQFRDVRENAWLDWTW